MEANLIEGSLGYWHLPAVAATWKAGGRAVLSLLCAPLAHVLMFFPTPCPSSPACFPAYLSPRLPACPPACLPGCQSLSSCWSTTSASPSMSASSSARQVLKLLNVAAGR